MKSILSAQDAINFLADYSRSMTDAWMTSSDGVEYKQCFDLAISVLAYKVGSEVSMSGNSPVLEIGSVLGWEKECGSILMESEKNPLTGNPGSYIRAIKYTRSLFRCSLKDGKRRVDELICKLEKCTST